MHTLRYLQPERFRHFYVPNRLLLYRTTNSLRECVFGSSSKPICIPLSRGGSKHESFLLRIIQSSVGAHRATQLCRFPMMMSESLRQVPLQGNCFHPLLKPSLTHRRSSSPFLVLRIQSIHIPFSPLRLPHHLTHRTAFLTIYHLPFLQYNPFQLIPQ